MILAHVSCVVPWYVHKYSWVDIIASFSAMSSTHELLLVLCLGSVINIVSEIFQKQVLLCQHVYLLSQLQDVLMHLLALLLQALDISA